DDPQKALKNKGIVDNGCSITNYLRYDIAMRYLEDVSLTMPKGILL
ncbi:hypothetical protein Tco_1423693, partial [Tanacetum coccineum]